MQIERVVKFFWPTKGMTKTRKKVRNKDTKFILGLPDNIKIDLVPSNELKHYERFQWIVTLSSTVAAGFWVAFCTSIHGRFALLFSALAFSLLTVYLLILSLRLRKRIFGSTIEKHVSLRDFE